MRRPSSHLDTLVHYLHLAGLILTISIGLTSGRGYTSLDHRRGKEGQIVLVGGGKSKTAGNVFVYHRNMWGLVCDDQWDMAAATVVCKQLGFDRAIRATTYGHYGKKRHPQMWLDNVRCVGDEKKLIDCSHNGWGQHDCNYQEAAGVECANLEDLSTTTTTTTPSPVHVRLNALADDPVKQDSLKAYKVRLVGGRNDHEGRIEVFLGKRWGIICGQDWGLWEATVACRQLGLNYAKQPVQASFFGGQTKDRLLNGIRCDGTELALSDCHHEQVLDEVICPSRDYVAGVICTSTLPDLMPNMTLLHESMYLQDRFLYELQCAMEENCVASHAYHIRQNDPNWNMRSRRLFRFSSSILNIGTADFHPFIAKENWEWHLCHMHYHSMDVFAHYDIVDQHGNRVAEGHKASFCLEDVSCFDPKASKKYACVGYGDQGISVGCEDSYLHDIDCQWIDITEMPIGMYKFRLAVNPEYKVAELDYNNNVVICDLDYTGYSVIPSNCTQGRPES